MKQLFLGSLVLLLFSFAIIVFQVSCTKDVMAQPASNGTSKILLLKRPIVNFDNEYKVWIADNDGSNQSQIVFNIPGWRVITQSVKFSGDGTELYFTATDSSTISTATWHNEVFTSALDGTNVLQITHDNASGFSTEISDLK